MIDGRNEDTAKYRVAAVISSLCREYGTDGLIVLSRSSSIRCDFAMEFFNPDGSSGMMCGNGGRCVVAFAADLGIIGTVCHFQAPDGEHSASIVGDIPAPCPGCDFLRTVRLSIRKSSDISEVSGGWFIDTGARHFVRFVEDVDAMDVGSEGREWRWAPEFAPEGTNVDFVQKIEDGSIRIRTFEKGVERETLACGTGITAAALVCLSLDPYMPNPVKVHARTADLSVESSPDGIFLTGPCGRCID